ncbi:enoyl-CoA hydratase-related protein [Duganella aceris]|uniref:Fatty acid oxidation complex subunit alpha n=1 Tax=Duganella aceris TaxID=2703883 RepID=A0ABX0FJI5_9BURK|nr:enoyl-CoA hydratase-related protein [Duganella aceris]NGZ84729.1 fatty acid oxidation complex subunit alpha [Duganella aceris]
MITTHQNGATVTVILAARTINPLSRLFQRELSALLDKLEAQRPMLSGVVVGFHAEAGDSQHELEHLMALTETQAADCMQVLAAYNALLRRLEGLGVPVVATLSGAVGGHALGLVLACHHRISLADAGFSLPQVHLGLAPVAGEIARTVRLTGLQAAMPLLLEGATLSAAQALQAGLVGAVAEDEQQMARLVGAALADAAVQPWDAKGFRLPGGELASAPLQALLQVAPAMLRARTGGHAPAPEAILCAMVEGLQVDFDSALLIESRYFYQTAICPVARNLMRLSQIRADLAAPAAVALAATLRAALDQEVRALRAEGVAEGLLRNAARAAGLPPPSPAAPERAKRGDNAPPPAFEQIHDRLLYAPAVAALHAIARGAPVSRDEADLISVRRGGFPAHTGGALRFVQHIGKDTFAARAAELGPRFAPPPGQESGDHPAEGKIRGIFPLPGGFYDQLDSFL